MHEVISKQLEFAIQEHETDFMEGDLEKAKGWFEEIQRLQVRLAMFLADHPDDHYYRAPAEQDDVQFDQRPRGW